MRTGSLSSIVLLFLLPILVFGQAPYTDTTCSLSTRICSGQTYNYPAWTGTHPAQVGPAYGCLSQRNDPAWFYFIAGNTGDVHIHMYSTPCKDIDFICWGPFNSLDEGCDGGLTASKIIDCSYGSACVEDCDLASMITGQYYVLLITNFSLQSCDVTFSQTSGSGLMICVEPPTVTNNGPVCSDETLELYSSTVPGGTYQWTGPSGFTSTQQNPVITNATTSNSGTYSVVVTVGTLVLSPVNTIVIVNPLPVVQIITPTTLCFGSFISIGGPPTVGYTYTWASDPAGFTSNLSNPSVSPLVNTTYYLTVTTAENCSASSNTSITLNPQPSAYVLPDAIICSGDLVPLGGNPNPSYTYSWTSNPPGFTSNLANPVVSPLITTTYTLILTNLYSCTHEYSVTITVNEMPVAYVGPSLAICPGTTVTIGTTSVPGNTYSWISNPVGFTSTLSNPTVSPSVTTTYTLTETNSTTYCYTNNSITVTLNPVPLAVTGPNTTICSGASVILGTTAVSGNTYSWTSVPAGFTSAVSDPQVSPLITTTYILTETSIENCPMTNQVVITVNPLPLAVTGGPFAVCKGGQVTLGSASIPGHTYSWTSNPPGFTSTLSNPSLYPLQTATYFLTETISATTCAASNSTVITVNPLPVLSIIPNTSICSGISISLGGVPILGTLYSWSSFPPGFTSTQANPTVSPTITTTYTLIQTISSTGCSKTANTTITVYPSPAVSLQAFLPACKDAPSFTLTGGIPAGGTYSGPGVINGVFNPSSLSPGIYNITYSYYVNPACPGSATQPIEVVIKPKISGQIRYLNVTNTLLDSCTARLFDQSNQILDSCQGINGSYSFYCLQNAVYKIRSTSNKKWGGGNAVDALLVAKYAVGLISFTDIQKKVGDVNLSGTVSTIDSYLIVRRWAGMINSFPSGNWYITKNDSIAVNNQDVIQNFQALCYGDVDGSYLISPNPAPEPLKPDIQEKLLKQDKTDTIIKRILKGISFYNNIID